MEGEKHQFNWKRLVITLVLVLFSAAIFGGGVWYFMDQNAKNVKVESDKEVQSLQKQVDELKGKTQDAQDTTNKQTSTTSQATGASSDYDNKECKFTLSEISTYKVTNSGAQNAWLSKSVFSTNGTTNFEITCGAMDFDIISNKLTDTVASNNYKVNAEQGDGTSTYYLASSVSGRTISIHFINIEKSEILKVLQRLQKY